VSIDSLSKGNKQKVVIAQAFLVPVGLVVLDEPHSGLDAQARRTLDDLIELERTRGAAVLMTSHTVPLGPESEQVYRIGDGCLYRMQSNALASELRRIELTATERSCAAEQILSAASLRSANHDQSRRVLSLVVEASDADALLHEAITKGWSVTGVVPLPGGGTWN
jgi:ABC-type multidrug transport system ATPase subunit